MGRPDRQTCFRWQTFDTISSQSLPSFSWCTLSKDSGWYQEQVLHSKAIQCNRSDYAELPGSGGEDELGSCAPFVAHWNWSLLPPICQAVWDWCVRGQRYHGQHSRAMGKLSLSFCLSIPLKTLLPNTNSLKWYGWGWLGIFRPIPLQNLYIEYGIEYISLETFEMMCERRKEWAG